MFILDFGVVQIIPWLLLKADSLIWEVENVKTESIWNEFSRDDLFTTHNYLSSNKTVTNTILGTANQSSE